MTNMVLGDSTLESLTLSANALIKIEEWTQLNEVTTTTPPMCARFWSQCSQPGVRRERERERESTIWFGLVLDPWGLRINRNHDVIVPNALGHSRSWCHMLCCFSLSPTTTSILQRTSILQSNSNHHIEQYGTSYFKL
jgi:hypothetical protein